MNVKIAFATVLWSILAAMLFVNPDFAGVSGLISICILGGVMLAITNTETEEEKVILSWVGIAASSILLLIVVYWGLIQ
jgi:hypothetical protein